MLKEISVKNYRNFKEKFTFNLESKSYDFNKDAVQDNLVKCGLIYGHNGCGKSNLMGAIADVSVHLADRLFLKNYDHNYIYAGEKSSPAEFALTFVFNGTPVKYIYSKKSATECLKEELIIGDTRVIYFDRGSSSDVFVQLAGAESLNLSGLGDKPDLSIVKYVFNNSVLENNETNSIFHDFMVFVFNMRLVSGEMSHANFLNKEILASKIILGDDPDIYFEKLGEFEKFLVDGGIKCRLAIKETDNGKLVAFDFDGNLVTFSGIASTGTLVLANLYVLLKEISAYDALILLDEFDAFYHHNLSWLVIEKLKQLSNQVLITTHNTVNLDSDLLRPDCMFNMTESQIKPFYACTNKELRKAHNYQKMYVSGAFDE